jgi:hypothetical protein
MMEERASIPMCLINLHTHEEGKNQYRSIKQWIALQSSHFFWSAKGGVPGPRRNSIHAVSRPARNWAIWHLCGLTGLEKIQKVKKGVGGRRYVLLAVLKKLVKAVPVVAKVAMSVVTASDYNVSRCDMSYNQCPFVQTHNAKTEFWG